MRDLSGNGLGELQLARHTTRVVSCDASIYSGADYFDGEVSLDYLKSQPALGSGLHQTPRETGRVRSLPLHFHGASEDFAERVRSQFEAINVAYRELSPTLITSIGSSLIYNNLLCVDQDGVVPVYENFRWPDRFQHSFDVFDAIESCPNRRRIDSRFPVFIGSAGSNNYGHWLVDDLTRIVALAEMIVSEPVTLYLTSYGAEYDQVRWESIKILCGDFIDNIYFLDRFCVYSCDDLIYITPSSYHPTLKSSFLLSRMSSLFDKTVSGQQGKFHRTAKRVFVDRPIGDSRSIRNRPEVIDLLKKKDFEVINPERMKVSDQWATFKQAEVIVGVMGAAMANTIMASKTCKILYLAPDGWIEPFFWDLSHSCHLDYQVYFGKSIGEDHSHRLSFDVDLRWLSEWLTTF